MNEEDSSDESEDNIVLDQSLTANVASSKPQPLSQIHTQVQPPIAAATFHPQAAQSAPPSEHVHASHHEIQPTIVTLMPPTLKSNKATNAVAANTEVKSSMLPPPPIPFHSQLNSAAVADGNRNVGMLAPQSQLQAQQQQSQPSQVSQALVDNKEENAGARVDPRVLKLMSDGGGANGGFFDLDLDHLTDKPWTDKNADITDWFNYGFNETTWKQYIRTQQACREALSKQHAQQTAAPSLIPQIINNAQYRHAQPSMSVVSSLLQQQPQQQQQLLHHVHST